MTAPVDITPQLAFNVQVVAVVRMSPSYVRVTFGGPSLAQFNGGGQLGTRDLRVKLVIASPGRELPDLADLRNGWYQRWLSMDPVVRGAMRTYTVRDARVTGPSPELDIDFVIHLDELSHDGPASSWAAAARVGDQITIIGPNARSEKYGGIEWKPPAASREQRVEVLMAGDETAVPAISSVLESLLAPYCGHAILEVPVANDFQVIRTAADVEITWLARGSRPHGQLLSDTVRRLVAESPRAPGGPGVRNLDDVDIDTEILWETHEPAQTRDAGFYAWIAGEAAMVRDLRRYLVRELGVDPKSVAFMGYWRQGKAEIV